MLLPAQPQHNFWRNTPHYARPLPTIQARKGFATNISFIGLISFPKIWKVPSVTRGNQTSDSSVDRLSNYLIVKTSLTGPTAANSWEIDRPLRSVNPDHPAVVNHFRFSNSLPVDKTVQ